MREKKAEYFHIFPTNLQMFFAYFTCTNIRGLVMSNVLCYLGR